MKTQPKCVTAAVKMIRIFDFNVRKHRETFVYPFYVYSLFV
jgi:hypothetical protein